MRYRGLIAYALMICAVFSFQSGFCQMFDTIRIDNRQSILNDRAFFTFPSSAKNMSRGTDIMAAAPNENEETRIVFDLGEMRLVFLAQEPYSVSDKNFFEKISIVNKEDQFETKILTDKEGLQSALAIPATFDINEDAILINKLIIKTEDSTLFIFNAYINAAADKYRKQFQQLAERVFSTLEKGPRKNVHTARQEEINILGTTKSLKFDLPANYLITVDKGIDFRVLKVIRYQHLGEAGWAQLIVYTGNYPSAFYNDYGLAEKDAKKIKGKFLDKKIEWLLFKIEDQGGFFDKEQIINAGNIEEGLLVHIAMLSSKEKLLDELTRIVETIQLKEK